MGLRLLFPVAKCISGENLQNSNVTFFYSSLVYMRPIFCRCFLFLMIGNML